MAAPVSTNQTDKKYIPSFAKQMLVHVTAKRVALVVGALFTYIATRIVLSMIKTILFTSMAGASLFYLVRYQMIPPFPLSWIAYGNRTFALLSSLIPLAKQAASSLTLKEVEMQKLRPLHNSFQS